VNPQIDSDKFNDQSTGEPTWLFNNIWANNETYFLQAYIIFPLYHKRHDLQKNYIELKMMV